MQLTWVAATTQERSGRPELQDRTIDLYELISRWSSQLRQRPPNTGSAQRARIVEYVIEQLAGEERYKDTLIAAATITSEHAIRTDVHQDCKPVPRATDHGDLASPDAPLPSGRGRRRNFAPSPAGPSATLGS